MQNLNKEKFPDSTIQMMWLDHLPPHIRSVLTATEAFQVKTSLNDLALLADKMLEATPASPHIAAITSPAAAQQSSPPYPTSAPQPSPDTQYLISEIRRLSLEVAELRSRPREKYHSRRHQSRHRYQSRSRNTSQDRSRRTSPLPYCHYHRRYGMDARKCTQPCSFRPVSSSSPSPHTSEN